MYVNSVTIIANLLQTAPGKQFSMEKAPFKLNKEMVDVCSSKYLLLILEANPTNISYLYVCECVTRFLEGLIPHTTRISKVELLKLSK